MTPFLTPDEAQHYARFREFSAAHVEPFAGEWDRAQHIPPAAIRALGQAGYLGANIPSAYGGQGWDPIVFGLLHEALGRGDSALTGVLTVQSMASSVLVKWGTEEQRRQWLPRLASGEVLGSFALTEPGAGSDLNGLVTEFTRGTGGGLVLNGEKLWISSAQMAGVFLIFGRLEGKPLACLVPRASAGLEIEPVKDLLGFKAAGLGRVKLREVAVAPGQIVGKPGFAFSHVAPVGLQYGRLSTACSSAGLLRACVEASAGRAASRAVGGHPAGELGMVQSLLARMGADCEAAALLCWSACRAESERRPEAYLRAFTAKYFSSRAATAAAAAAVQIHGAAGCQDSLPVARYYRGAKIMEIIEGTTQVHEAVLGRALVQEAAGRQRGRETARSSASPSAALSPAAS